MKCPHCDAPVEEDGAKFCGECGGLLEVPAANAAGATDGGALSTNPLLRCPSCGAGPGAIDDDGFCNCGAQRRASPRDHVEVVISPKFAGVSDIGKRHHQNEDSIDLATVATGEEIACTCDGVSQSQRPQEGSKAATEAACASAVAQLRGGATDGQTIVRVAIEAAQEAICKVPYSKGLKDARDQDIDPAEATIVLTLVQGKKVHIGWAGDSRAYWASKNGVVQLTKDDSWADEQVAAGLMTMEEAMKQPNAHAITNALGADADGKNPGIKPNLLTMNVTEPGRLIICTDGFWNYAEDPKQIAKLIAGQAANIDALSLARVLVNFARDTVNGGKDNISVTIREF